MTQSSCKRDTKSKSHLGMKLAPVRVLLVNTPLLLPYLIAAAVSEPEANERGSSLIGKNYIIAAFNHFFLPEARNCGYARKKDLGCAMDSQLSGIWCYFIRRTYFDNSGLRSRLQSCKISSESDQQSKSTANCRNNGGNPTTEVCLQFFIFLRSLFSLLCFISALRNIVLGKPFGDFLFVPKWASIFLIFLNCSLNPYGLVHFDHLNVTFTINVDFYPPTPRPKYNYDFKKANLIDLKKTLEHIL